MTCDTYRRQMRIMLYKNFVLSKRNRRATCIQLFVPFILSLFLFVIQFAIQANEGRNELIARIPNPRDLEIPEFGSCRNAGWRGDCISLAYTPAGEPVVESLISMVKQEANLVNNEVLGFQTQEDLNKYLISNKNKTQAGVHFYIRYKGPDVVGIRYALQINQTDIIFETEAIYPTYVVQLPLQEMIERTILRYITNSTDLQYDLEYATFAHPEIVPRDVVSEAGPTFYFGALMFNFVIQMGVLVSEKEFKLKQQMQMMGLKDSVYWISYTIVNLLFNYASALVLIISGLIFQFNFFLKNDFGTYFFHFFFFVTSMVPLVFFLSVFVSKSKTATVLGFGVFLVGAILTGASEVIYQDSTNKGLVFLFTLLPFSLLSKGMADLSKVSNKADAPGLRWADRGRSSDFYDLPTVWGWMMFDFFLFYFLAIYLEKVLPNADGSSMPWYFCFKPSYWVQNDDPNRLAAKREKQRRKSAELLARIEAQDKGSSEEKKEDEYNEDVVQNELRAAMEGKDEDVKAEDAKVETVSENDYPVLIKKIGKVFEGYQCCIRDRTKDFFAVRGLSIALNPNQLFCLLGHNGAGKTTLINMLVGNLKPSFGDALILGNSIRTGMHLIQKDMGVCPQHDVLWDQLTAGEHIAMFALLKGMDETKIKDEIDARLKDVGLLEVRDRYAGNFSGGMRRRLSVAIALVGNPGVVYLDEPTTGMDPVSRRQVWDLIERVKHERLTILTTHSMEEADVLGDRIGIMKKGKFIVLGTGLRLKNKFGSGYRVAVIKDHKSPGQPIIDFFSANIQGSSVAEQSHTSLTFKVPRQRIKQLPSFFEELEKKAAEFGISDVQLSLTTLEEIFLAVGGIGEDERIGQTSEEGEQSLYQQWKKLPLSRKVCYVILAIIGLLILIGIIGRLAGGSSSSSTSLPELQTSTYSSPLSSYKRQKWTEVVPGGDTQCVGDSPFKFFFNRGSSLENNLIISFEGGEICYDFSSCDTSRRSIFNSSTYIAEQSLRAQNYSGVFDKSSTSNPFSTWDHIYIPLCTADNHWGNSSTLYEAGLSVDHKGAVNVKSVLDWIAAQYSASNSPARILVTGWGSSGAAGALLWAPHLIEKYPTSKVMYVEDVQNELYEFPVVYPPSAANSSVYNFNRKLVASWGLSASAAIPSWVPGVSLAAGTFSTDLFLNQIASHYANHTFVRVSGSDGPTAQSLATILIGSGTCVSNCAAGYSTAPVSAPPGYVFVNDLFINQTAARISYCNSLLASGDVLSSNPNYHQFIVRDQAYPSYLTTSQFYSASVSGVSLPSFLLDLYSGNNVPAVTLACASP